MSARIAVVSDLHCGSVVGICPPGWGDERAAAARRALWAWYKATITSVGRVTHLFVLGDCIDGRQEKDGSTGLIAVRRDDQCDMAVECLRQWRCQKTYMVRGTAYHTGAKEDWEDAVAAALKARIDDRLWVDVGGVVFDLRHHIGSSSLPHTRGTALSRERLLNGLWSERADGQPRADVILRGHTHYHTGTFDGDRVAMTVPCLQLAGGRYGMRKCSGLVDVGLLVFDIDNNGGYTWRAHLAELPALKAQVERG